MKHLFRKGHKHSEETKRKIGEANKIALKGHIPWNKGLKNTFRHTEEAKKKISRNSAKIWLGKKLSKEHRQKLSKSHIGKPGYWTGKKRPPISEETRIKMSEGRKGILFTKEHRKNISEAKRGYKNPNWQDGISFEPYSVDWTDTLKRAIRERDNYICQLCNKIQGNRAFSVHHIDYNKQNCNPGNLITLCISCNNKVNKNRDYWKNYFMNIKQHNNEAEQERLLREEQQQKWGPDNRTEAQDKLNFQP